MKLALDSDPVELKVLLPTADNEHKYLSQMREFLTGGTTRYTENSG